MTVNIGVKTLELKKNKIEKLIKAFVSGAILQQADAGIDITGSPYKEYSPGYKRALARASEDTKVDLRLSGSLLTSIKSKSEEGSNGGFSVVFAPDTGSGPKVTLGQGKVEKVRGNRDERGRILKGGLKKGERRAISNNILAYNIHNGEGNMPKRPFLGLTPENQAELLQILREARIIE